MDIIRLEVYFLYPDQTHRVYLNKSFYCVKVKVRSLSCVQLFVTPWTVTHQAPLSMGFSRQEYWSGLPFPSPGDLPDSEMELRSLALQADSLSSESPRNHSFVY